MQIVRGYARASFLAILFTATFAVLGHAQNTIRVPADFPSIQEAMYSANNGDIILVSPGTYFEPIFFLGKNVTVQSTDGPSVTIVDGANSFTPVSFFSGEGPQATLRGFTITHGFAYQEGGGIRIANSSPTIENNVITANQACDGGGISAVQSSAIIRHNIISNNTSSLCFPATGGAGVKIVGTGSVQLLNNTITGNQLSNSGNGGGIVTDVGASPLISGNLIQNNSSTTNGGGLSLASFAQVVDNIISGNIAAGSGGGIYSMVSYGSPALVNNTAVANSAAQGPELYVDGSDSGVEIANNLFIDLSGTGAVFCGSSAGQIPTFDHNDVFSAAPTGAPYPAYAGACSDATGSNGNIQAYPQFVDSLNGNYHLQLSSPAVDSGNSGVLNLPPTDLDGNIRIATSNIANCAGIVDMGAYEIVAVSSGTAVLGMSNVDFGTTFIGAPPAGPQIVTMIGTQGCAQVASISTSGDFQQTNNCNTLLAPNSCTIQVTFSPTAPGLRAGSLKVQLSDGSAPITASLTGQGQNSASVFPASLNFGLQPLQTSSFTQYVDIEGSPSFGFAPLQVSSISISGDFFQTNSCIPSNGWNACAVSVTFTPTVAGLRTGMLTIVSNQGVLSVPLSGFGAAPAASLAPASLAFPTQLTGTFSPPQTVTLTNVGTTDLQMIDFTVSSSYAAQPVTCGAVLSSGSSCTYSINFTPFFAGNTNGVFEVDTNGGPVTVALSGSGVEPILNVSPQSLILDAAPIGGSSAAQTVTITNISANPLQLTSIGAANNFVATSACPGLLDPNASCTIDVSLVPFTPGPYGGFLTIATNIGNVTAALSVADTRRTLHVPAEFATIGWAISNANNGDTILVSPGTYNEQINFGGKAITVSSITGPGNTILDAQNFFIPVVFQNFEPAQAVLRGFTITNGFTTGIQISNASPTIAGNIISSTNSGPGITASSSAAVIQQNFIVNNNNQYGATGQGGGGILVVGSNGQGRTQLLNNTIIGNQELPTGGAGIAVISGGNALIQNNIIQNNTTSGYGGGILINGNGTADIVQNLITGNAASIGGGIYDSPFGGQMVLNNTVANNSASSPGAAVSITGFDGGVVFINNLLVDPTGLSAIDCGTGFWQAPAFLNNDIVSLVAGGASYTGGCTDMTGISGNISQDPQFMNPGSNNYHVLASSPAVDAGSLQAPTMPDKDLDGNPRIGPGNAQTCLSAVDLGVYELQLSNSGSIFLPANLEMGTTPIGGASTGGINFWPFGCLQISSVKTTGDFQQANSCTGAISSSSGGCSIQITFTPTSAGAESGTLIVDFGPTGPAQTVNLFGTGFVAPLNTTPQSLDFGSQTVQTSSTAQGVNILGNYFGPSTPILQVNGIWVSGDFSQTNNCGFPLASGSSCSFAIVFTPTATGSRTGSLVVSTNVGLATVFLSGNGVAQ